MNKRLKIDSLAAEKESIKKLISHIGDKDIMSSMSLNSRLEDLEEELSNLTSELDTTASAALFFGGKPVVGSRGIEANFATKTLKTYQDLVAKIYNSSFGEEELSDTGALPSSKETKLHITEVVHGSFGFLLEELEDRTPLVDSRLKKAVCKASELLVLASKDTDEFEEAVSGLNSRTFDSLRDFFKTLSNNEATLRLVSSEIDQSFSNDLVGFATSRTQATVVDDSEIILDGEVYGILPDSHQFEFYSLQHDDVIKGKVTDLLETDELKSMNEKWAGVFCKAKFRKTKVTRAGKEKIKLILLGIIEKLDIDNGIKLME